MDTKVMVIDNNRDMRDLLASRIEKAFDLDIVTQVDMDLTIMNQIKSLNPEIVVMNIVPSEYDAAKIYMQLLIEDSSVRFLTLSRYEKHHLIIAWFDSPAMDVQDKSGMIENIFSLAEELAGTEIEHTTGSMGKYILKGVSLQCA
jgi:DNA-binding NarL/FixJ family response regulator